MRQAIPRHAFRALFAAFAALGALRASADTIVLRNGQQLQGRVTYDGNKARIELDIGATLVVDKGEIEKATVEGPAPTATGEAIAVSPELLARLEARERTHALVEALLDDKEAARLKAEGELAHKGPAALPIVRAAFAGGTPVQRRHLLRVLASIGDPASVPKIVETLRNPNEKDLHAEAAKALAAIAGHEAEPVLTEVLVNAKEDDVRLECLKAIEELGSPFGAPFVVDALRHESLRQAARAVIARWDDPVLLLHILPLFDDAARESRERVASWLVRLVDPAHAYLLTKLLELHDDEKEVAKVLRSGVARLHHDFPVVSDVELLNAPQSAIRKGALDALSKLDRDTPKKKQRGATPRDWRDVRDEATVPHLVLIAVGTAARPALRDLATDLATSLKSPGGAAQGIKVDISTKVVSLAPAAEPRARDARPILAHLDREQAADPQAVRIIGVTAAEVSMPGLDHAMAPTRPGGAALVSLARLGDTADQRSSRARRLVLHALARSLGFAPCGDPTCPSGPLYAAGELDARSSRYCAACQAAFTAIWAAESDNAAFHYAAAGAKLAAIAGRSKSREGFAAAAYALERGLQPLAAIEQWKNYQGTGLEPAHAALVVKRIELLDRAEKWLTRKKLTPAPAPAPPPKGRGG